MTYFGSEYHSLVALVLVAAIGYALWAATQVISILLEAASEMVDTSVALLRSTSVGLLRSVITAARGWFRRKWPWIAAATTMLLLAGLTWVWISTPDADPMQSREAKDCERLLSVSNRAFAHHSEDYRRSQIAECVLKMRGVR